MPVTLKPRMDVFWSVYASPNKTNCIQESSGHFSWNGKRGTRLRISIFSETFSLELAAPIKFLSEKNLFLDPVILYQTKRFRFQDRKFMLKHKLSIPSRNLCQVDKDSVRESKACA